MTVTDITNFISGALPENTVFSLNLVLRKTLSLALENCI